MLYQIILNFSLLFTFTVLIYWPFIHYFNFTDRWNKYLYLKPIIIGFAFGIIGSFMPYFTLYFFNGLILSARVIPLLFCGLLGGPFALLIAGMTMTVSRFLFFDISEIGMTMSINFLLISLILFFVSKKLPIHFRNIHQYLFFSLTEIAVALFIASFYTHINYFGIIYLVLFNWIIFFAIKMVLVQSQYARDKVELSLSLDQKDYLTQLPNNHAIEAMLRHHTLHEHHYAFLFIDIDHFKHFNVDYGYLVGDSILKELAQMLKDFAQKHRAEIGRLSGEEFCCILKDTVPAVAVYQAEQFRLLVENHTFGREHGLELSVTISIGITNVPDSATTLEEIFKTANLAISRIHNQQYNYVQHIHQSKKG